MKKAITSATLTFLLLSMALPTLFMNNVNASDDDNVSSVQVESYRGQWVKIKTDLITILFPAGGKKPMFLWWYSNDTNDIHVVKYKGLVEYMTIDYPYYLREYEANALTMRERLEAKYATGGSYQVKIRQRIWAAYRRWFLDLHPAYLPFSACQWNLTGPVNVTREDGVSYISFNFTLVEAPSIFDFAEGNVMIRCRFYATEATENVYDLYNYTVKTGELKMDLVIQNWEWNIDKLNDLFDALQDEFEITVPQLRAGLALWVDMASINITDISIAEQDANLTTQVPESSSDAPLEPVEVISDTSDIIAGGQRIQVQNKIATETAPINVGNRLHERFRLRFARGSQTLAGFFDFVNTAVVINSTNGEKSIVNVAAAYIPAGNHLRLFIGYPYFGNNTLEHDPSIGVESVVPWLPTNLLMILIGATIAIAIAVATVKLRKKPVNIINVQ